jgi:PAS domain S-box-containing protein
MQSFLLGLTDFQPNFTNKTTMPSPPCFLLRNTTGEILFESPHFSHQFSELHSEDVDLFWRTFEEVKVSKFRFVSIHRKSKLDSGYKRLKTFFYLLETETAYILEFCKPYIQESHTVEESLLVLDASNCVLGFNSNAQAYFNQKGLLGLPLNRLFDAQIHEPISELLKTQTSKSFETFDSIRLNELKIKLLTDDRCSVMLFSLLSVQNHSLIYALKQSKSTLQAILENSSDAFVLVGFDYEIISFNRSFNVYIKRFLNLYPQEGQDIRMYVEPEALAAFQQNFSKAAMGERVVVERLLLGVWFSVQYSPVFWEGDMIGVSISFTDIDRRKRYELKLEAQNQTLSRISQIQSHDVRRPLANILGLIDLIKTSSDPSEINTMLEYLQRSATVLDQMIHTVIEAASNQRFES